MNDEWLKEREKKIKKKAEEAGKICVRVDCSCPFNAEWPYYPKDIIGIHRISRYSPKTKIGELWATGKEQNYCHGTWYSQGCDDEDCEPHGKVAEILEDCDLCPYNSDKIMCPFGGLLSREEAGYEVSEYHYSQKKCRRCKSTDLDHIYIRTGMQREEDHYVQCFQCGFEDRLGVEYG